MFFRAAVLTFLFLSMASLVTASAGDRLYVLKSGVNVRSGPGTDNAVVMQLNEGHELTEIKRQDSWVQADISWTGGQGWIHSSLVDSSPPSGASAVPEDAEFKAFVADIESLNQEVREILGDVFFKRVAEPEEGTVRLTATRTWLSAPQKQRQADLDSVFALWQAHQGPEQPVAIQVVDPRGEIVMQKTSR